MNSMKKKIRSPGILVVDGSVQDYASLEQEFLKQGKSARIDFTRDGEEAIAFLLRNGKHALSPRPSLILLDLNLVKKGGYEFLSLIKNDPDLLRIPIIVLAGDKEREIATAYGFRANCCVLKPHTPEQFTAFVDFIGSFWLESISLPE